MTAALAPWAVDPARSRGRRHPEPPALDRGEHQRDRDRVVHSTAFRRLMYKTQVFINHEGDLFRTRLTHSLEVAQLSRSVARTLALNEDLVEAIALAHDMGHTPFGHAGQDALQACMAAHGGFEHNLQSLRVVDRLEQRYPAFDGLNLSFETREGILKHCSRRRAEALEAAEPGGVARRFIEGTRPSLEAQVVNLADEIAYNAHDVDDGMRSGLLDEAQLVGLAAYGRIRREVLAEHPGLESAGRRLLFEVLRRMLAGQVRQLVDHLRQALREHAPADADALRRLPLLAQLPPPARAEFDELKRFLFSALYRHPQVMQTTAAARQVVSELFDAYAAAPQEMPADFSAADDRPRAVADYIAGMTDRFALREYHRLTGRVPFPAALHPAPAVAGA
ncbi:MAG: deoxyguanosinetriphosphate triphosphohydrolase [Proteobacteria bacterium]|nr:deoxyguanosinetriphosphate triphosphohydrolase [Pseudomonadota bacterium]